MKRSQLVLLITPLLFSFNLIAQNVGIGTTTPGNTLHVFKGSAGAVTGWLQAPLIVEGSTDNYINILAPNTAATGILFGKPENNISGGIIYNNLSGSNPNGFDFRTNGNISRMVLTNVGNLGVGTVIPENTLHVLKGSAGNVTGYSGAPLIVENSTSSYINILAPDAAATGILFGKPAHILSGGIVYNNGTNPNGFDFRTNGNITRMVLDNFGFLGVGTASPTHKLHVVGNGYFLGTEYTYGVYADGYNFGVAGNSINGAGVYGSSSNNHGGRFESETGQGLWAKTELGTFAGVFQGNVYSYGTYQGSDKILKKNIQDVGDAMSIINKLKPKKYDFRNDGKYASLNLPKGDHYGLIAQDVEEVLPNLVKECSHDIYDKVLTDEAVKLSEAGKVIPKDQNFGKETIKIKAINYVELIPVLIKGMQEQQLIIEEQKLINEKQKIKITILEDRLAKLEAALASITAK